MDNSTDRCRFYRGAETGLRGWRHGDMAVTKRWENVLKRRDEHLVAMRRCGDAKCHGLTKRRQRSGAVMGAVGNHGQPWQPKEPWRRRWNVQGKMRKVKMKH